MTRRLDRIARALALSLCLTGCAENAILELDLVAPPPSDTASVISLQVLSSDEALDAPQDLGVAPERLVLDEPTHLSVVADSVEEMERPLYLGVSFCADPECAAAMDPREPTLLVRVERAFYLGRYTHLDLDLRGTPAGLLEVSRCAVRGCGAADGSFCFTDADGAERHFCER